MTPELIGIISVGVLLAVLILAMMIRIETRSEKHPEKRAERPDRTGATQEHKEHLAKLEGEVAIMRDYIVSRERARTRM